MPIRSVSPADVTRSALVVGMLALGASSASASVARPAPVPPPPAAAVTAQVGVSDAAQRPGGTSAAHFGRSDAAQRTAAPGQTVVRSLDRGIVVPASRTITVADAGFDWGSAAIGAGSGAALLLLAAGGVVALRPRGRATA